MIAQKLDPETREDWEISQEHTDDPDAFFSYAELVRSLEQRVISLEAAQVSSSNNKVKPTSKAKNSKVSMHTTRTDDRAKMDIACHLCKKPHLLYKCYTFKNLQDGKRIELVKREWLCDNCLSKAHATAECNSTRFISGALTDIIHYCIPRNLRYQWLLKRNRASVYCLEMTVLSRLNLSKLRCKDFPP